MIADGLRLEWLRIVASLFAGADLKTVLNAASLFEEWLAS